MSKKCRFAIPVLLAIATAASAQTESGAEQGYSVNGIAFGAKISNLGAGLDLSIGLTERVQVRLNGNYLPANFDATISSIEYEGKIKAATLGGLVDFYPFNNRFRLSAGFFLNGNRVELDAEPTKPIILGANRYTPEEVGKIKGDADFRRVAPYIGLGYGVATGPRKSFLFFFDLGLLLQGPPDLGLTADGAKSDDPVFQADLKTKERDIIDSSGILRFYPVLAFGLAYNF